MAINTLNTEINNANVQSWITTFQSDVLPQRLLLDSFYRAKDIINKADTPVEKSTRVFNKIHSNYAKMIVNNASSYLVGKPVTYAFDDEKLAKAWKYFQKYNDETAENLTLAKSQSRFGIAYELMGIDKDKRIYIKPLSPLNTFFVKDSAITEDVVCAITYWTVKDSVTSKIVTKGYVYTTEALRPFTNDTSLILGDEVINPFKPVMPVFEYKNNDECLGDYESVTELLSAYNKLLSTNFDDVDGIANAILALYNASLAKDENGKLRYSRVIELLGQNAKAEYIYKKLDKDYVEYLRNAIRDDIFSITNIPDLTDDSFSGNVSGVALSYKLIGFDNLHQEKSGYFEKGLTDRIECFVNYKNLTTTPREMPDVNIEFYKNLPQNIERDIKIAELAFKGAISKETAIDKMEIVTDTAEELKRLQSELPEVIDDGEI